MNRYASPLQITLVALVVSACGGAASEPAGPRGSQGGQLPTTTRSPSSVGAVTFDHEFHSENLKLECKSCHHETNASTLRMPHKDYFDDFWIDCRTCHKTNGKAVSEPQSCSTCHHDSPTNIADETLSSKVVTHEKCSECHELGRGATASKSCATCHEMKPETRAGTQPTGASTKKG